jgi:hypothetical protein
MIKHADTIQFQFSPPHAKLIGQWPPHQSLSSSIFLLIIEVKGLLFIVFYREYSSQNKASRSSRRSEYVHLLLVPSILNFKFKLIFFDLVLPP